MHKRRASVQRHHPCIHGLRLRGLRVEFSQKRSATPHEGTRRGGTGKPVQAPQKRDREVMADQAKKWPVVVNAAAGLVLAGFIGWQFIGADEAAPEAPARVAEAESTEAVPEPVEAARVEGAVGVDGERIANADAEPGNWLAHGRSYDEQRFSPLDQITPENIGELSLAWSTDTDTTRGLEATPIVVDGIMYLSLNWGI